jgi:hypothetical protein
MNRIPLWRGSMDRQVLRLAVRRLKSEVEAAWFAGRETAADQMHDDLVSAEFRLRMAERRHG